MDSAKPKRNALIVITVVTIVVALILVKKFSSQAEGKYTKPLSSTEREQLNAAESALMAKHSEKVSKLLPKYNLDSGGWSQIAIFEELPKYYEGAAVIVTNKESPIGLRGKPFTMSGKPAVSFGLWDSNEQHQVSVTLAKDLLSKNGTTKITPALCGKLGERQFSFRFVIDKDEYESRNDSANCDELDGEIISGGKFVELNFRISDKGQRFRIRLKARK